MGEIALSSKQRQWLESLKDGDAALPIRPYSDLAALGLVEKVDQPSGKRGYTMARITAAGHAQL